MTNKIVLFRNMEAEWTKAMWDGFCIKENWEGNNEKLAGFNTLILQKISPMYPPAPNRSLLEENKVQRHFKK